MKNKIVLCGFMLIFAVLVACGSTNKETAIPEDATPMERIWHFADDMDFKKSDLKVVQGTPDTDRYGISFHFDDIALDETSFMRQMFSAYVDICRDAYALDDVNIVEMYVFTDMTDQKGNTASEKVFSISMEKDKFQEYNWDNLNNQKVNIDVIQNDCRIFYVHPGIFQNFNEKGFYYSSRKTGGD